MFNKKCCNEENCLVKKLDNYVLCSLTIYINLPLAVLKS